MNEGEFSKHIGISVFEELIIGADAPKSKALSTGSEELGGGLPPEETADAEATEGDVNSARTLVDEAHRQTPEGQAMLGRIEENLRKQPKEWWEE
jgi:hypothetical protein